MKLTNLQDYAENEIRDADASVSLLVYDLTGDETLLTVEAERRVVSASTIKTQIMLAALDLVQKGEMNLEQRISIPCDEVLEDTEVFNCGQQDCPLEELITWMIIASDNTATNVLIEKLGMDTVNEYCTSLDLKSTALERKMLDWDAIKSSHNNYTSAADQFITFSKLYHQSILTPAFCELALNILKHQRDYSMAMRYLCPPDITFAHKTGGLDHLNHDTGIFICPGTTIILDAL